MFEVIGLTETAENVYRMLLAGSDPAATGLDGGPLRKALAELSERGLVNQGADGVRAAPPDMALDVLLLEQERKLKQARLAAQELADFYHTMAEHRRPTELVEVVTGRPAILQRWEQATLGCREQCRGTNKAPFVLPPGDMMSWPRPPAWELLERGVAVRMIYDAATITELPEAMQLIDRDVARGEQARVFTGVPIKLLLCDDRYALMPLEATPTAMESAVIIQRSSLLEGLIALFESMWAQAQPMYSVSPAGDGPTPDEARLLACLTAGMPDARAAKQLGLSYSTLQRRMRQLMDRLGATTRFQAGRRAAQLGWLEE